MVQTRKDRKAAAQIKLAQPDRSAPSEKTLFDLAEDRQLFEKANAAHAELSPTADRIMDSILWSVSLSMLHFTLDVLVQHQYAVTISWPDITSRSALAIAVFFMLVYVLHPHASSPVLLPGVPLSFQHPLRQAVFFITSVAAGCYLIHVSTTSGYLAVMKRSPPLGCLWVWAVIELDLLPAVLSVACAGGFFYRGDYSIKL
ncbi:hypothetical protein F5Y15DRAFT_134997 [Xylariaceae sp. FL0016]|nr:hypothetical protein F5Y15DRAFT_134997 [Xylariaceae sp. FL0016]